MGKPGEEHEMKPKIKDKGQSERAWEVGAENLSDMLTNSSARWAEMPYFRRAKAVASQWRSLK